MWSILIKVLMILVFYILEELREHFSLYGDIESINVKTDPNTGRSRGFAFIVFAKAESLDKVIIFRFYDYSFGYYFIAISDDVISSVLFVIRNT